MIIFLLITVFYALLMFNDRVPLLGLVILSVLWLIYWVVTGQLSVPTPMDMLIFCLLILLVINMTISVDRELSFPKAYGLILSILVFYVIVNAINTRSRLPLVIISLAGLSLAIALLALVGADWSRGGASITSILTAKLASLMSLMPMSISESNIHVNTIGGALAFFVPLLLSFVWDKGTFHNSFLKDKKRSKLLAIIYKLILIIVLLLVTVILFLTRSRGAYLGCISGLLALLILKNRHFLWVISILAVGTLVAVLLFAEGNIKEVVTPLISSQESPITDRLESWKAAIYLMQDFPFTGAGMGTFGKLSREFYTITSSSFEGKVFNHAHNTLLTVVVDMGLPALILYMALLSSFGYMVCKLWKSSTGIMRVLLAGLVCGMLAHQVFGLLDAYMLGANLGMIMWIYFGITAALFIHSGQFTINSETRSAIKPDISFRKHGWQHMILRCKNLMIGLANWVLFSMAAIAFIYVNPYLSLALAILGGILLGIFLTKRFSASLDLQFSVVNE